MEGGGAAAGAQNLYSLCGMDEREVLQSSFPHQVESGFYDVRIIYVDEYGARRHLSIQFWITIWHAHDFAVA